MTDESRSDPLDDERRALLRALLAHVAFDGWTRAALLRAGREAGVEEGLFATPAEALDFWIADADQQMLELAAARDLAALRIRERVTAIVRLRLELLTPHREALRRALAAQLLPGRSLQALRGLFATADAIWHAAGDTATDFNWYTKRALLSGVYASTLLFWLADESEDFAESWAFLDRRIAGVMRIEKGKGRLRRLRQRLRPRRGSGGEPAPA